MGICDVQKCIDTLSMGHHDPENSQRKFLLKVARVFTPSYMVLFIPHDQLFWNKERTTNAWLKGHDRFVQHPKCCNHKYMCVLLDEFVTNQVMPAVGAPMARDCAMCTPSLEQTCAWCKHPCMSNHTQGVWRVNGSWDTSAHCLFLYRSN